MSSQVLLRRKLRRDLRRRRGQVAVGFAIGPGLVLGRLFAQFFYGRLSTDQITFEPLLQTRSWAFAVALVLICAVVGQVPGLRRLERLDLATKVRERAL